jgi:hypothetical protein
MEIENVNTNNNVNNIDDRIDNLYLDVSNVVNNIGAISNRNDSYKSLRDDTKLSNSVTKNDNEISNNISVEIYRYKFTDEFTNELFKFSKIHQYDERKIFKEAWELWIDENDEIVNKEYRRLKELGYDGDIFDKMFKSARYYFRKKSTEKKEPAKRRIYVGSQKDLLEAMDEHIYSNIKSGNFKPSDGFDEFCKENINLLKEEVNLLCRAGLTDSNEIKAKIKKTYKNRYFLAISK